MNEATFKVILIGDSGTGKSCLLARYVRNFFAEDYAVTVGTNALTQELILPPKLSPSTIAIESNCKFGIQPARKVFDRL